MSCKVNGRFFKFAFAALCLAGSLTFVCAKKSPKIVIVGAGAAGIAAAVELVQKNFDVTILEASGRIGGRIHTHKFGNILIDRGAQWVNGEQGNPVWEVANPLGLLEKQSRNLTTYQFYTSYGEPLEVEIIRNLTERIRLLWSNYVETQNVTFPVLAMKEIDKFYVENPNMGHRKEFEHWLQEMVMNFGILDTWDEVVPHERDWGYPGDWNMNWKEKGFSMIFDIMTKKYPDPKREIPVMKKVRFRKEVNKIDYSDEKVKIYLSDGEVIAADDVIFTPSLGYLKAHFTTLFKPSLPDEKIHVIKNFGFGDSTKILMLFNRPWWNQNTETGSMNILWTEDEMKSRQNDPLREWQNHVLGFSKIEHKPNLLLMWVNGQGARDVERMPQDLLIDQVMELLEYIKEDRIVEPPIKITRTMWNSNKHVLGTCSFRGIQAWKNNINLDVLSKEIPENNPRLYLAGEATDSKAYGSVSGAINSGRRQARKIVEKYKEK